jgi:purine-binding chemotaxis protein CheW
LPSGRGGKLPMNVVVRANERAVSLLVDEIGDVLDVPGDSFEQSPTTLDKVDRSLCTGVYKLDDKLLLVLDTDKAVARGITNLAADLTARA